MGPACTNCNGCKGQEGKLEFENDFANRAAYNPQYTCNEETNTSQSAIQNLSRRIKSSPQLLRSIIKFQALFRGYMVRCQLSNRSKQQYNIKSDFSSSKDTDYVENYKFPNGAIYTGTLI